MRLFEPEFSEHSYGFRPGRSTHQAVQSARRHVASGRRWVVDIDLEKFFDRVGHDILMSRVSRKVKDRRVLRLIRRYLTVGVLEGGIVLPRVEGTPQGGPLSPLLSNILLDEFDKELERRNHAFCRYADDCNIYVHSRRAAERVMASLTQFLEQWLKLKVNSVKSAVGRPWERTFLGYSMTFHKKAPSESGGGFRETAQGWLARGLSAGKRMQSQAGYRRVHSEAAGLDRLLSPSGGQGHIRGSRWLDQTETALHPVASVEAPLHPCQKLDAAGINRASGVVIRHE